MYEWGTTPPQDHNQRSLRIVVHAAMEEQQKHWPCASSPVIPPISCNTICSDTKELFNLLTVLFARVMSPHEQSDIVVGAMCELHTTLCYLRTEGECIRSAERNMASDAN